MSNIVDIFAEARSLVSATDKSYPDADLLRRVNDGYEETIGFVLSCDGRWQFDDSRYTDFPIGVTNLVDGQQDYAFDPSQLQIERVEIQLLSGIWQKLRSIDMTKIRGAVSEYMKTPGQPTQYDKFSNSIFLYCPPSMANVTLAGGLRVYFKRTASLFQVSEIGDTTKSPGFAIRHLILARKAALPYAMIYKPARVNAILSAIAADEAALRTHYTTRSKDEKDQMTIKRRRFK